MGRLGGLALALIGVVVLSMGHCEMSIYPGLRRKPMQQSMQPSSYEVSNDFLNQLMEENARRRLQHQFEQQLELIKMQMNRQRLRQQQLERERYRQQRLRELAEGRSSELEEAEVGGGSEAEVVSSADEYNNNRQYDQYDTSNPEFSFKISTVESDDDRRIPFAVGPSDPRFYEEGSRDDDNEIDSRALDDYEEYVPAESRPGVEKIVTSSGVAGNGDGVKDKANSVIAPAPVLPPTAIDGSTSTANFHRIHPQNAAAAAVAGVNVASMIPDGPTNNNALHEKLQKQSGSRPIQQSHDVPQFAENDDQMVVRQRMMGMDGDMGMYIVALIAGISAAVTVGLIALALTWFHSRSKAAADVDYPAYGVTGPNKDISPSGDRKLAQSAQMYHYQHQKQQIIAMENRQPVEGSCGLSDVESDDDNEEGDYTVYECPGLAPTGEMEVKNPLFLDDTPVTPSSNATAPTTTSASMTQATLQQPQGITNRSGGKSVAAAAAANATPSLSSDDKKKKQKK